MRVPIGLKIFGIALALLILMAAVALLRMQMTRTLDDQLAIIDQNYLPGLCRVRSGRHSVEESAYVRQLRWRSPNLGIMPRNSISCASKPRTPARQATNGLPMRANTSTGRSPARSISKTTSRWRGAMTKSGPCRRKGSDMSRSSASC